MTKKELIAQIALDAGVSLAAASRMFESMILNITRTLKHGETVQITNFGAFSQLMRAATRVLSDIEAAYRPPVRQALWAGEYARVRTCALWDLQDAVVAIKPEFGQRHSPEEQARLNTALAQVFDWPKEQVQPQPSAAEQSSIHTGSGAIFGDLSTSSCPAEREAFEAWAAREGLSLLSAEAVTGNGDTLRSKGGLCPATYYYDETEWAWMAWANKPSALAGSLRCVCG